MRWDTSVVRALPSFALADAGVTSRLLMKHTVCACAGLPREDMEFFFGYAGVTAEERVASMSSMTPTTGFGETFQYSNTMVATGGYAAGHLVEPTKALGVAFDDAMQTRVLGPLGMSRTTMDFAVARRQAHASPHAEDVHAQMREFPLAAEEGVISVRPAGGAWSTAHDLSKYLMLELAKGRDEAGKTIVSEANLLERRRPQVKITSTLGYGLGLFVETDRGVPVVHHGGNLLGFTSDAFFLPEEDIGVVLLTNAGEANEFRSAVRQRVMELVFDAEPKAEHFLQVALDRKHQAAQKEARAITGDAEDPWFQTIAGTYEDHRLGSIAIRVDRGRATLDAGEWASALGRKKEDDGATAVVLLDPPLAGLELALAETEGRKTLVLNAPQQRYVFELRSDGATAHHVR